MTLACGKAFIVGAAMAAALVITLLLVVGSGAAEQIAAYVVGWL
jgi:hypothetical protein